MPDAVIVLLVFVVAPIALALVIRGPAGEPVRISGGVERTGGDGHSLHVYVKPIGDA